MSKNESNNSGGGLGLFSVLQIIFIVLKLVHVINWSWWIVFAPTFVSIGIVLLTVVVCAIISRKH